MASILLSWYHQCHSAFVWKHSCSQSFPIKRGVVLSPCFTLFVDARSIASLIFQCQLISSFSSLDPAALPRCVFTVHLAHSVWSQLLARNFLPLFLNYCWCLFSTWLEKIHSFSASEHMRTLLMGGLISLLSIVLLLLAVRSLTGMSLSDVVATMASLFRIQLLVGCGGLSADVGCFHDAVSSACPPLWFSYGGCFPICCHIDPAL